MENEKLKTCGDCIHADLCKKIHGSWFSRWNIAECTAFKDEADLVPVQKWIPVTERLPEKDKDVLCLKDDGYHWIARWDSCDDQMWDDGEFWVSKSCVTHWMPLPPAPKEE